MAARRGRVARMAEDHGEEVDEEAYILEKLKEMGIVGDNVLTDPANEDIVDAIKKSLAYVI